MEIVEKREIYDLSDNCMVKLSLKIKKNKQKWKKKRQWRNKDYHKEE